MHHMVSCVLTRYLFAYIEHAFVLFIIAHAELAYLVA